MMKQLLQSAEVSRNKSHYRKQPMHFNKCSLGIFRSSLKMNMRNPCLQNFGAIYSPVIVPGDDNRIIYIYRERGETDSTILCYARGSFPGKRVFLGGITCSKMRLGDVLGEVCLFV